MSALNADLAGMALQEFRMGESEKERGPFDSSDMPNDGTRLDLGSLRIPSAPELEVRVELDPENHQPQSLSLILPHSIVSVQAFASAKYEDTWPSVRDDVVAELTKHGINTDVRLGVFGTEIHTVMPSQEIDGETIITPVRFLGFDGDRWFLRVVVSGAGAIDEAAALEVDDLIADIVVHRGHAAMSPGEPLPLTLPENSETD